MKVTKVELKTPKTKAAATNQAAYVAQQIDNFQERKKHLMENRENLQQKVARLQGQLQQIEETMAGLDQSSNNWSEELKKLKMTWQLTDAEILETKSALLRKQIAEMQKKAGIQDVEGFTLTSE